MDTETKDYIAIFSIVLLLLGLTFLLSAYWHKPIAQIEMYKDGYKLDYVDVVLLPNWNGTFTVEVVNVGTSSAKLGYVVEPANAHGLNLTWNGSDVKLKPNNSLTVLFAIATSKELDTNEVYVKVLSAT